MTSKILSFSEFVDLLKPYMEEHNNTYVVNNLIKWIINDDNFDIGDSTVSRYLNNQSNFSHFATSIRPHLNKKNFQSKFEIGNANKSKAGLDDSKMSHLSNDLKSKGFKNVHPSSVPRILANQFEKIIQSASISKSSSNLKNATDFSINTPHISKAFSLFVSDHNVNDTGEASFTIKNNKWDDIQALFNKFPIIMTRAIFQSDDPYKIPEHPYGEFADTLLPNYQYLNEGKYTIEPQNNNDITQDIYIHKNGKPVEDVSGKPMKVFKTIKEMNPPVPECAYLGKVISFTSTQIKFHMIKVVFRYKIIKKFDFRSLYDKYDLLGIPNEIFFNNELKFIFFNNISEEASSTINKIVNTK